jgi:hypothetical protein
MTTEWEVSSAQLATAEEQREIEGMLHDRNYIPAFYCTIERFGHQQQQDTAEFIAFSNETVSIGVEGLIGCISLTIISRDGVYMTHWWQDPSFANQASFAQRSLRDLLTGTEGHPSLRDHQDQLNDAIGIFITPCWKNMRLRYAAKIRDAKAAITRILPDIAFFDGIGGYEPQIVPGDDNLQGIGLESLL